jgi:hypothetical protein
VTVLGGSVGATTPELLPAFVSIAIWASNQQPAQAQTLYVLRATAVIKDIYFRFSQPLYISVELCCRPPLSLHGPSGTSESLVALCNLPCAAVAAVVRLQTGVLALQRYLWRSRSGIRLHNDAPGASGTGVAGDDFEFSDAATRAPRALTASLAAMKTETLCNSAAA